MNAILVGPVPRVTAVSLVFLAANATNVRTVAKVLATTVLMVLVCVPVRLGGVPMHCVANAVPVTSVVHANNVPAASRVRVMKVSLVRVTVIVSVMLGRAPCATCAVMTTTALIVPLA